MYVTSLKLINKIGLSTRSRHRRLSYARGDPLTTMLRRESFVAIVAMYPRPVNIIQENVYCDIYTGRDGDRSTYRIWLGIIWFHGTPEFSIEGTIENTHRTVKLQNHVTAVINRTARITRISQRTHARSACHVGSSHPAFSAQAQLGGKIGTISAQSITSSYEALLLVIRARAPLSIITATVSLYYRGVSFAKSRIDSGHFLPRRPRGLSASRLSCSLRDDRPRTVNSRSIPRPLDFRSVPRATTVRLDIARQGLNPNDPSSSSIGGK